MSYFKKPHVELFVIEQGTYDALINFFAIIHATSAMVNKINKLITLHPKHCKYLILKLISITAF